MYFIDAFLARQQLFVAKPNTNSNSNTNTFNAQTVRQLEKCVSCSFRIAVQI